MKNTTKKIIAVTSASAVLLALASIAQANESGNIYINNTALENAKIQKVNDNVLLPLRSICEEIGFEVNWIQDSRTIELVKMPIYITCSPDYDGYTFSKTAPQLLGTAPELIDDTTYVPMNFVNEILHGEISVENGNYYINYGETVQENTVSGTVCDIIYEDDKITQIVIGNAEDVNSQTALNLSEELSALASELNIVIGSNISATTSDIQTMSIPPQFVATSLEILYPEVSGTVCDMIYKDDKLVQIVIGDKDDVMTHTILNVTDEIANTAAELGIDVGTQINAQVQDIATLSLPPQMIPVSIEVVEAEQEEAVEQTEDISDVICELVYEDNKLVQIVIGDKENPLLQTALNLSDELGTQAVKAGVKEGMTITATASAMKTRSIPAQQALISISEIK